ncbi:unnamed protein product [Moneuplotes crassus]|uniref:Uncharacterized protein n=1 Tax=Euplotes crassus TaxID=5936 RepID=A0AAD1Y4I3_EUPCR|nr:unnamed protein product [Moneuplotes crassus]
MRISRRCHLAANYSLLVGTNIIFHYFYSLGRFLFKRGPKKVKLNRNMEDIENQLMCGTMNLKILCLRLNMP